MRPCRTPHSSPRNCAIRVGTGAPTIRSSKPSPLTSPAEATEPAAIVNGRLAADLEAVAAVEGGRQVEIGGEARGLAEHHIARPGTAMSAAARPDDQVVEAVAVDVAGRGDREPL